MAFDYAEGGEMAVVTKKVLQKMKKKVCRVGDGMIFELIYNEEEKFSNCRENKIYEK